MYTMMQKITSQISRFLFTAENEREMSANHFFQSEFELRDFKSLIVSDELSTFTKFVSDEIFYSYVLKEETQYNLHSGSENLKKSRPKKLVKTNKSISRIKFLGQIPFFAISKMAKNQFLN